MKMSYEFGDRMQAEYVTEVIVANDKDAFEEGELASAFLLKFIDGVSANFQDIIDDG